MQAGFTETIAIVQRSAGKNPVVGFFDGIRRGRHHAGVGVEDAEEIGFAFHAPMHATFVIFDDIKCRLG